MSVETHIAAAAALIGEPARAAMLALLKDGRAYTASELGYAARIAASTASSHLAKLLAAGLVEVERQGRHRYYRLSGPRVAAALDGLAALPAVAASRRRPTGPRDAAMRYARSCYDHLAGEFGVALTWRLVDLGYLTDAADGFRPTSTGRANGFGLGIELPEAATARRPLTRTCLDWSERRPHLAGVLGARVLQSLEGRGWVRRRAGTRTVTPTAAGRRGLEAGLGLSLP